jgi:hypothetical protein
MTTLLESNLAPIFSALVSSLTRPSPAACIRANPVFPDYRSFMAQSDILLTCVANRQ